MCKVQMLRALVKQRLTAAAEEIFGLFERTIAEYEEQLCRSKEENERQRKLLDAVYNPQLRLHRADVQQLLVVKEEVPPEQQEWSSSVDQEDPEPPHIKEEEEELWSSQEGEQLQGLEEADITKFTFTPVPVKSEDDEEKPQSEGHHCGGPGPDRNSHPDTDDETGDSSEAETEDSDDWTETREPQSGLNSQENDDLLTSDSSCSAEEKLFSCSVCKKRFSVRWNLKRHMMTHTGEKPFSCLMCGKRFHRKDNLSDHMAIHTEEKTSLSDCGKSYIQKVQLTRHTGEGRSTALYQMRNHQCVGHQSSQLHQTKEYREVEPPASGSTQQMEREADGEDCGGPQPAKNSDPDTHDKPGDSFDPETDDDRKKTREPQSGLYSLKNYKVPVRNLKRRVREKRFSCSECGKRFDMKSGLTIHMRSHTGEKPFSCSVCKMSFTKTGNLRRHMRTHTGERRFKCSECGKTFGFKAHLERHIAIHTREKPFSCSECGKQFCAKWQMKQHMRMHTGEKCFSCSECGKRFCIKSQLEIHIRTHTGEKPFSCLSCKKSFGHKQSLKAHMTIHTGEKPSSCKLKQSQTQTKEIREAEPSDSSSVQQMEKEADGEDCGGPQPARNSNPDPQLQPHTGDKTGDYSDLDTDDSDDWKESRKPQSGLTK
ncbi:uncharacterized protein LOC144467335 [Epinephelus lanceolatus]